MTDTSVRAESALEKLTAFRAKLVQEHFEKLAKVDAAIAAELEKMFGSSASDEVRADLLAADYIRRRDAKDALKAEQEKQMAVIVAGLDSLEQEMMTFLNQTGQQNANTKFGTFAKKTNTSAKVADRDMFMKYVLENEATNFLESRVNKTAVEEYIAEHGALPPGIDVTRMTTISVTRPKKR